MRPLHTTTAAAKSSSRAGAAPAFQRLRALLGIARAVAATIELRTLHQRDDVATLTPAPEWVRLSERNLSARWT